ncbi:hypothetical protein [Natrinema versiforme]|uniref:PH domain-containing protein n=1 Tax=Natrinema versiforme JCM 10478 TaxID=1227496 RepID=L9XUS5_9EURY|nr:hypothetical protein [Natrinema versiforme]ELY65490.1 hypothetical protein C489_14470 [Natrinema versiforme JCM 10478]
MSDRKPSTATDTAGSTGDRPDAALQLAFGGYVGVLAAGVAAVVAAFTTAQPTLVLGAAIAGVSSGCLVGLVLARRVRGLAGRIGRTRRRRVAVVLFSVPFGVVTAVSVFGTLESRLAPVALLSAVAVAVTGSLLEWVAQTRYVDAVTGDDPGAAWPWTPPSNPILDVVVLALWLLLGGMNAATGDWTASIVWFGLAIFWVCGGLAEGRWRVGSLGDAPEVRVYEAGLVKRRPYTRSLVPWTEVSHVRLREDELVIDRGFFDVRFDRDELADLEALQTETERHLPDDAPAVSAQ